MSKKEKENSRFEITEMFMAKTNPNDCYYGCIKRGKDENGNDYVFSRIVMPDGLLCARAEEQNTLGKSLDEMAIHSIKRNLHGDAGRSIKILGTDLFLN